jgi:energy-coupling factor transporter ATP-binding protein EcfA2
MNRFIGHKSVISAIAKATIERAPEPAARIWLDKIVFSDNTEIKLKKDDVLVIVGPNNCGKSATLRAINSHLSRWRFGRTAPESPVVKSLKFQREGDLKALHDWLERYTVLLPDSLGDPEYTRLHGKVDARSADEYWKSDSDFSNKYGPLFSQFLDTEGRLKAANAPKSIAITTDSPEHPIHAVQLDENLEASISRAFMQAFGQGIVLQHGGSEVPIRVGEIPQTEGREDRVSASYLRKLEKLTKIEAQGDGMRSFLGILLFTMSGAETVLLIDEPEAFLHPPQAKHLGKLLVSPATLGRQLIIATHSSDLVKGFLEGDSARARIVRVRRVDDINVAKMLPNDRIKDLWGDPLLRHSNILDGLFHDRVIVCEADADCLFYSAIKNVLEDGNDDAGRKPDVMFTHCGGKDRLSRVVKSLRELDVPVSVIAVFDVLKEERTLQDLVEAAGGRWEAMSTEWREVKQSIEAKRAEINVEEVKGEIRRALEGITGSTISDKISDQIRNALRRSSPWDLAKKLGLSYVPSGQPTQRCLALLDKLAVLGIFVVRVGEMEEFVKSVGVHGPRWVSEVLKKDLRNDQEFDSAKDFVKRVLIPTSDSCAGAAAERT